MSSQPISPSCERKLLPLGLCALVVLAGLAAYSNSFSGVFVFDDTNQIVKNPVIDSFWTVWPTKSEVPSSLGRRRPVAHLTLAVNYAIGGFNPTGYHVFNLAVHLLAGLALLGLVRRTLLLPQFGATLGSRASYLALAAAIVWTVHPLGTQSVTYVIQRCESLMGLCYLAALYFVVRGSQSTRSLGWYVAAVVAFCVGLGSKEVMATAPLVILLYDRVFLSDSWRGLLRRRWGLYLALSAPLVRMFMAVSPALRPSGNAGTIGFGHQSISSWDYLSSQPGVILHYLRLAFWPAQLCLDYDWPVADSALAIFVPGAVVVALVVASFAALRSHPSLGFLGLSFFLILAPTSSILPINDLAFEHRMYLPLAVIVVLAVLAIDALARRHVRAGTTRHLLEGALLGIVVVSLTLRTFDRNRDYQDLESMWSDVLVTAPYNPRAHVNLGYAYETQERFAEAIVCYEDALRWDPNYSRAHFHLGHVYGAQEEYVKAASHYEDALRLKPDYVDAHNNLGYVLSKQGNLEAAIRHYDDALSLNPNHAEAHFNLGFVYGEQEKFADAIRHYQEAIRLNPDHAVAHFNLGYAHSRQGNLDEAIVHYLDALRLDPDDPRTRYSLALALTRQGDLEQAATHFEALLRLEPDNVGAHKNFAVVLTRQEKHAEAADHLRRAIAISPNDIEAHQNLAIVLSRLGDLTQAASHYEQVLRIKPDVAATHFLLAGVLERLGNTRQAVDHLRLALSLQPNNARAAVALSRILATSNDPAVRNGAEAARLAERLDEATGGKDPAVLDILAAAYAEAGRWDQAVATAERAIGLATAAGQTELVGQIEERLQLYQQRKPFRDRAAQ